jgi:hypothetical protein
MGEWEEYCTLVSRRLTSYQMAREKEKRKKKKAEEKIR